MANRQRNAVLRCLTSAFGASGAHSMATLGVSRDVVVQQDQKRCRAPTHEFARDREDKVGVGSVHFVQKCFDRGHRQVGSASTQRRTPALDVVLVEEVGQFRTKAARLCQHGGKARLGTRRKKFHMKGPLMQKPITRNLSIPK